jgi:hypothetical protein
MFQTDYENLLLYKKPVKFLFCIVELLPTVHNWAAT